MIPYRPERILIEEEAWGDRAAQEMLQGLPGIATRTIPNVESTPLWFIIVLACARRGGSQYKTPISEAGRNALLSEI